MRTFLAYLLFAGLACSQAGRRDEGAWQCKLDSCRRDNDVIRDQLFAITGVKNEAQGRLGRVTAQGEYLSCKLDRFESAVKKCTTQASQVNLTRLGEGVYHFYNDLSNLKNKFEAFVYCRSLGMNVVSLETAQENQLVKQRVEQLYQQDSAPSTASFYISLNDFGEEGVFSWSGSGQPATFLDWAGPDGGAAENCAQIVRRTGGSVWDDVACTTKGRVVCEMLQPCAGVVKNTL